jgi:hypothetical protein
LHYLWLGGFGLLGIERNKERYEHCQGKARCPRSPSKYAVLDNQYGLLASLAARMRGNMQWLVSVILLKREVCAKLQPTPNERLLFS